LVENLKVRDNFGGPGRRWEYNIKNDLREIGWEGLDWIRLAQVRGPVARSSEHGTEPSGSIKGGK
jgi:hypothetical protein